MKINFAKTDRGFMRGEFLDRYGKKCIVQESSIATEQCIWLGTADNSMHLTQGMVSDLLPVLKLFAYLGRLGEDAALLPEVSHTDPGPDPSKSGMEAGAMTWEHSQAISLKRIADAIEGHDKKLGLVDSITQSIEYGITNALRR